MIWTLVALMAGMPAYIFYSSTKEERVFDENLSNAKMAADRLPENVSNNNLRRVKQSIRLPDEALIANGIRHGLLEGTAWRDTMSYNKSLYVQKYWNDEAAYRVSMDGANELRKVTFELHNMCLEAVNLVVESEELMDVFEVRSYLYFGQVFSIIVI